MKDLLYNAWQKWFWKVPWWFHLMCLVDFDMHIYSVSQIFYHYFVKPHDMKECKSFDTLWASKGFWKVYAQPYRVFSGCTQSQDANIHMAFQFQMKHLNKIIQHKYGFIFNYYVSMCAPYYQHEMEENISPYLFWYFLGFIINF